ncbi:MULTISPECIES: DUF2019 domain-containing protein [Bacteroides]|jgi:hypothetical protein|uniref:DUF2019 domain-containing protein n=1 Tax=Bacteroides TaxID=816 RepID=UPI000E47C189|nr:MULTISPECIES: DUF2019 domain-containing protein [Bacteroides]QNL37462.1 DUF2019 domain-containing protein [Bacteroides sp. M10]RGR04053.1 DUF2019 domain-containing protein [Bacteroides sp. AF26-7BH]RGY35372.1 DUF2019 domain-containing protein [Bacteroides sp. OF02-3LB]HJA55866.1 DUF2019 domain-containing protein [Candidatus Bacteroides intestinigallinarum]
MRKIKNLKEALEIFEDAAIKQADAIMQKGSSKIANRNYDKILSVAQYLRENKLLPELSVFYMHPNLSVRSWAAAYLLPVYEEESIKILEEIAKFEGFGALDADILIKEWKKGKLRDFYTL